MSGLRRMAPAICLLLICMACARGTRPRRLRVQSVKGRVVTMADNILQFPYRARAYAVPARNGERSKLLQAVLAQPDRPIIHVLRETIIKGELDK